jgi:cytochrome c
MYCSLFSSGFGFFLRNLSLISIQVTMKKVIFVLFCGSVAIVACNSSGSSSSKSADSASTTTTAPAPDAASEKGLELIGASDCTTCHRLHKESAGATIGPAYSDVAAKYAPAADTTVDRLVHKIISGGSGVWGAVPMTPHPALPVADVREMVTYILSLKK